MATEVKILETKAVVTNKPSTWLDRLGFWSLLLLVLSLPFELTQKPFLQTEFIVVSNLKLVFLVVAGLAIATLFRPALALLVSLGRPDHANYLYRQRFVVGVFLALLVACALSSLLSGRSNLLGEGLKWTFHLGLAVLVGLAIPRWLTVETSRKIGWLGRALVFGAVVASVVGFMEFILGRDFAQSLVGWFKTKPTEAGPFLRLSGTFEYANIAALYFELALPFALLEVVAALDQSRLVRRGWSLILLWSGAVVILLMALLLTLSRGALLGLAVGLVIMAFAVRRAAQRKIWWWVIGLTGLAGVGLELLCMLILPQFALRFNSQSDQDWFKAAYNGQPPASLNVCQKLTIPVTVKNLSPLTWEVNSTKPYNLSYHWLTQTGAMAQFEGIRTPLPAKVDPGDSLTIPAEVLVPAQPGAYSLVWDMVQEDVSWFSLKSSFYTKIPIQVNDLPATEKAGACNLSTTSSAPARPAPKELPTVLIQPDRQDLWKAALAMVAARPGFGVGPNAFRFRYGDFSQPRLTSWDQRIFANSLPLEIFADLGLIGGLLFFGLLTAFGWRLVKLLGTGRGATLWQIALIGTLAAFLGHGILDYILGSNAISCELWILLGLAATIPGEQNGKGTADVGRN